MSDVLTQLRDASATVAERAQYVRVNHEVIPAYAASLPDPPPTGQADGGRSDAAFWLTLDAINFGSGWFPTLRKRAGESGYRTVQAGLRRRFETEGRWSADELQRITPQAIADTLSQDPDHELMRLFARSLNDLGDHIDRDYGGRFDAVARGHSAVTLVERLASWDCFADTETYGELTLPFLKRAQIVAADLARAGAARFSDLDRLTLFADNLVPHVLRLDGVLGFDPDLVRRINDEKLIEPGSREEVEIRACAVHAVELIVGRRPGTTAAQADQLLWLRGQQPRYKSVPRPRCRCTAY